MLKIEFTPFFGSDGTFYKVSNIGFYNAELDVYEPIPEINHVILGSGGLSYYLETLETQKQLENSMISSLGKKLPLDVVYVALTPNEVTNLTEHLGDAFYHTEQDTDDAIHFCELVSSKLMSYLALYYLSFDSKFENQI